MSKTQRIARAVTAALLWGYWISNTFFFGIDEYLSTKLSSHLAQLLPYKALLLFPLAFSFWYSVGHKYFFLSLLYIIAFPLVVIGKLGAAFYRSFGKRTLSSRLAQETLTLAGLIFLGNLKHFRSRLFGFTALALGIGLIVSGPTHLTSALSIGLLLLYLAIHFGLRIRGAFDLELPPSEKVDEYIQLFIEHSRRENNAQEAGGSEKEPNNGQGLILAGRVLRGFKQTLAGLSKGHRMAGYFTLRLGFTVAATIVVFALIYLNLVRIDPNCFSNARSLDFGHLLFYSFATVFPAHVGDFAPDSAWAMVLIGIEAFLSWVILGLLFSQFTSLIVSRYTERMKELGGKLGKHVASIKKVAVEDFQMTAKVVETEIHKPLIGSSDSAEIDHEAARRLSPGSKAGQVAYINHMQEGARLFRDAQNTQDTSLYLNAAAQFRAATSMLENYPEVVEVIDEPASSRLNEAYALINAGDQPAAIAPLEGFVERANSVGADQYTLLGQLYLTNDRAEDAIPVLEDGAHVYPNNSDIQSLLLNAYNAAGQTEQAIAAYRNQVQNDPNNALYLYNLGSLLLNDERYDEAIRYLGRTVQQNPSNANAQYNYGAAHVNKAVAVNDEIATLENLLRTNEQDLSDAEAQQLNSQVESLAEERTELFQDAISPLEHALELTEPSSPNRQSICRALFSAYVQTGQEEKAREIQRCAHMDVDL